jgi:hypothetical protein
LLFQNRKDDDDSSNFYFVKMKISVGRRSSADTAKSEAWLSLRIVEKLLLRHSSFDLGVVASTIRVSSFRARGMIG